MGLSSTPNVNFELDEDDADAEEQVPLPSDAPFRTPVCENNRGDNSLS